jgi:hypothetical protein
MQAAFSQPRVGRSNIAQGETCPDALDREPWEERPLTLFCSPSPAGPPPQGSGPQGGRGKGQGERAAPRRGLIKQPGATPLETSDPR